MSEFFVYADDYIGRCYWSAKRGRVSSMFSYSDLYITGDDNWNIDPLFVFEAGAQPSGSELPGAFRDASPDRWGRGLIERRFQKRCSEGAEKSRSLNEVDYLLGVSDYVRQGCLRFSREEGGVFEHPSSDVPRLVELPKLLRSARQFALNNDEVSIEYLLNAGSASLGGARPKAAVRDGESLFIAKFPHRHDSWDVMAWEWVALKMAKESGIVTPEHELVSVDGQNVLLTERFDRVDGRRVGYISAMTLLGREDGEHADYVDIAMGLRDISYAAADDDKELFRRIVFSIFVNNTDDHLRNHGLIRNGSGWRLSPMFDVNPNPEMAAQRVTSVFGETEKKAALSALTNGAEVFGLGVDSAEFIIREVKSGLRSWEKYAKIAKIPQSERSRFSLVFEVDY